MAKHAKRTMRQIAADIKANVARFYTARPGDAAAWAAFNRKQRKLWDEFDRDYGDRYRLRMTRILEG